MKITFEEVDMLLDEAQKALYNNDKLLYLSIHLSLHYFTTNELLMETYKRLKKTYQELTYNVFKTMVDNVDDIFLSKTIINTDDN